MDMGRKVIDTQGPCEVAFQPIDRPRYLLTLASRGRYLAQTRTLIANKQAVKDFSLDDRRKDRDILRFSQQVDQPLKGSKQRQRDPADRHSTA